MRWKIPEPRVVNPWKAWFAWHPVEIGNQKVWLEWVDRKYQIRTERPRSTVIWVYRFR